MLGQTGLPSKSLRLDVANSCGRSQSFSQVSGGSWRLPSAHTASLGGKRRSRGAIQGRHKVVTCSATSERAESGNPVVNLWTSYTRRIDTDPVPTKALTSFFGFVIGDFLAQKIEGDSYDIFRCLRLGTYGLFLDGPIGHWWYTVLDKYVEPDDPRSTKAVLLKTAADQIIWAPVMTCVFFAVLKSLEGQPELIIPTIQDKLIKTIAANYVIWPAAHFINFRFVPTEQRILYNNCVSVAWTAWLSTVSHDSCRATFSNLPELWHFVVCVARDWTNRN